MITSKILQVILAIPKLWGMYKDISKAVEKAKKEKEEKEKSN